MLSHLSFAALNLILNVGTLLNSGLIDVDFTCEGKITETTSSSAKITVTNLNFEVDKVDGTSNFSMWQCEVLDILGLQELDIALEEKPKEMNGIDWAVIKRQACSTIRSCLAKDLKHCVLREDSAKNPWKTLEDKYRTPSLMNRFNLWKKLLQFQCQPGISMNDHINTFNGLLVDLSCLGKTIEDEDKVILLKSLPAEYEDLAAILLRGKDKAEYDVVCAALLNYKVWKGTKCSPGSVD